MHTITLPVLWHIILHKTEPYSATFPGLLLGKQQSPVLKLPKTPSHKRNLEK